MTPAPPPSPPGPLDWSLANHTLVGDLLLAHLWLTLVALGGSALIAIPLGWIAARSPRLRTLLITSTGLLFAIPSLALFAFLPLILGTPVVSRINVAVALTLAGIAILTRAAADAFRSVSPEARTASIAVGFSPGQVLCWIDLPLAGPGIIAGLRVVAASVVSLASVGALVGVRSLGYLFTDGFGRNYPAEIVVGIVLTIVLAALLDGALVVLERFLVPWARQRRHTGSDTPRTTPSAALPAPQTTTGEVVA